MGLDTSHEAWHGPYSQFNRFRRDVAKLVGIDLNSMEGFGHLEGTPGTTPWESLPPDDIHILLDHSDCEGEIAPDDCARLAKRLRELVPQMGDDVWRKCMLRFATGCEAAAAAGEPLDFH